MFVTRKWAPAVGGMETYSVELTTELARHISVEVVALSGNVDGSRPQALALISFAFKAISRYLRRENPPTILHIGDMASWPLALMAWTRFPRASIVISAHGTDVSYHRRKSIRGWLYGTYLRAGARLLHSVKVIANSAATMGAAGETGWHTAAIVPLATRLGVKMVPEGHNGAILFVGRLVERKGCLWFVRNVLPLLPSAITLKVAGTLWDELESAALDDPRVEFLGPLHGEELLDAYRSAMCVILPNIEPVSGEFEGFGLVAAEAAASGGVVLAARCGGLIEAVIDRTTGFLLSSGKAGAWRDKILEIAEWSANERHAFACNAMKQSQAHYSWPRVAKETLTVYYDAFMPGKTHEQDRGQA